MREVDWSGYARQYDLMARNNPAYQELVSHCLETVRSWGLKRGSVVADFGAGTGNFSTEIAWALPEVSGIHIESNEEMTKAAKRKAALVGIKNMEFICLDLEKPNWSLPRLDGAVAIHSLYTLKAPVSVIKKLCVLLRKGGFVYACDLGRSLDIRDWTRYLLKESIRKNGLLKTTKLFWHGIDVKKENRKIADMQRRGKFWLHNVEDFRSVFESEGIEVSLATNKLYRGYDDLVVGRKL